SATTPSGSRRVYTKDVSRNGIWLRAALSGKPLDKPLAHSLTRHFITQHLPTD
ncbi:hypothetical protein ACUODJ_08870, partial [Escherichia sp. HC-CC]